MAIMHNIASIGGYEICARVLILVVAFVPFFAFWELGRVFGMRRLATMFFSRREQEPIANTLGRDA